MNKYLFQKENVIINIVIISTFCFKISFSNKKYEELKVNKYSIKPKIFRKMME